MIARCTPVQLLLCLCPVWIFGCDLIVGDLPDAVDESAQGGDDSGAGASGTAGFAARGGTGSGGSAGVSGSAGQAGSDGGCFEPCDCDHDGDRAKNKDCAGKDCDDHNGLVKSTQTDYFEQPAPGVGFDYDCSGNIEREYDVYINCALLCETVTQGFLGAVPECGWTGRWGKCKGGVICSEDVLDSARVSRCH